MPCLLCSFNFACDKYGSTAQRKKTEEFQTSCLLSELIFFQLYCVFWIRILKKKYIHTSACNLCFFTVQGLIAMFQSSKRHAVGNTVLNITSNCLRPEVLSQFEVSWSSSLIIRHLQLLPRDQTIKYIFIILDVRNLIISRLLISPCIL